MAIFDPPPSSSPLNPNSEQDESKLEMDRGWKSLFGNVTTPPK